MSRNCLAGIDGGGTKTVCILAGPDGEIIGQGRSGSSNLHKDGLVTARDSLRLALEEALREAGVTPGDVSGCCGGFAGVDRPRDRHVMGRALDEILPDSTTLVESDAFIALVGALEGKPGTIVIAGTGSIALGVNRDNLRVRAGGWGHILGDEGSGYDIARKGLIAALHHYDGRGPETAITEVVVQALFLDSIEQVIPLLYSGRLAHNQVAALLPLILKVAEEGDRVALQLIEEAAASLARTAAAVVRRLGCLDEPHQLAACGGVFQNSSRLREAFALQVRAELPRVELRRPAHPAEVGAVLAIRAVLAGNPLFTAVSGGQESSPSGHR